MSEVEMATIPQGATDLTLSSRDEEVLRGRVRRWARRFLGLNDREFEDPYQTAWVRAMEYTRAGRPIRNLEHFLRWEVGNGWKMELRRRRRRPSIGFEDCSEAALASALVPDVAEQVERLEDARLLLGLMSGMETRRQRVLLLREAWGSPQPKYAICSASADGPIARSTRRPSRRFIRMPAPAASATDNSFLSGRSSRASLFVVLDGSGIGWAGFVRVEADIAARAVRADQGPAPVERHLELIRSLVLVLLSRHDRSRRPWPPRAASSGASASVRSPLAALDVHDPKRGLFGHCEEKTGIEPFSRLVEQVMITEPYASPQRVFWIVDKGGFHAGRCPIDPSKAPGPTLSSSTRLCMPRG